MGHRCGGSSVRIAWRASAIARRKRLSTGKGVSGNRATALRNWRIENIWLTQKMMATLYGVDVRTINEHIKKIYSDSELEEDATIRNFRIVQTEGSRQVTRDTKHYNLQMIIAVGFKVNNERAVQFRKWANGIVKDYTIKGWVMDKTRCIMRFMDIQQRS